jgi:hypothetical protein
MQARSFQTSGHKSRKSRVNELAKKFETLAQSDESSSDLKQSRSITNSPKKLVGKKISLNLFFFK